MAPTPLPILVRSPGGHLRHLRRQGLDSFNHPLERPSSAPRTGHSKARTPDVALQPSVVLDGPSPTTPSTSSPPATFSPEPSAMPVSGNQQQEPSQPVDISGNIVAAVVVVVLILGGLVGLVLGGEMLRRRARTPRGKVSPLPPRRSRPRKPKPTASKSPQRIDKMCHEKYPYDEKTLTPLTRPLPVLNRERSRRFPDVWPIRSLSRVLSKRQSYPEQVVRPQRLPPAPSPQTTWSDFSPISLYAAPPRTVLACIPEELEECQSQSNSDIAAMLGVTLQPSLESDSAVSIPRTTELKLSLLLEGLDRSESSFTTEQRCPQDCESSYNGTGEEDTNSSVSSAPDMISDGGKSSRTSTVSLESLGNDRESLQEEVFELRRAQTRSMQMNKGVLLSLSLKTLDDSHEECGPSPSAADAEDVMLDGNLSAVSLDEFPSPPSILPVIPSFVSGF